MGRARSPVAISLQNARIRMKGPSPSVPPVQIRFAGPGSVPGEPICERGNDRVKEQNRAVRRQGYPASVKWRPPSPHLHRPQVWPIPQQNARKNRPLYVGLGLLSWSGRISEKCRRSPLGA